MSAKRSNAECKPITKEFKRLYYLWNNKKNSLYVKLTNHLARVRPRDHLQVLNKKKTIKNCQKRDKKVKEYVNLTLKLE